MTKEELKKLYKEWLSAKLLDIFEGVEIDGEDDEAANEFGYDVIEEIAQELRG